MRGVGAWPSHSRLRDVLSGDPKPAGWRSQARRLMKQAGVAVGRPTRRPVTTDSRHGAAVAPTLWARPFEVEQPDTVWAGDITNLWTAEGWWYLAPGLALSSRKVGGGR